jgi:hypothetical protein
MNRPALQIAYNFADDSGKQHWKLAASAQVHGSAVA